MTTDPVIEELKKSKQFFKSGSPPKIPQFYQQSINNVTIKKGLYLEFGTGVGDTAIHIANKIGDDNILYTFDWFRGLPEDWYVSDDEIYKAGHFKAAGNGQDVIDKAITAVVDRLARRRPNIKVVIGRFEETLPIFLQEHTGNATLIHVDCDVYSSTKTVFDALKDRIIPGTVIIFDEFWNYSNYRDHEYAAFMEFVTETKLGYRFLGHVADKRQASLVIE